MADESFSENPWSPEFWNLTRQGAYVALYGVERAKLKAKRAGAKFGNYQIKDTITHKTTIIVQRRNISGGGAGDGGPVLPTALATKTD